MWGAFPILVGVVMLAATTFLTASLLYGGLQSVAVYDARDSQLLITIAEDLAKRSLEIRARTTRQTAPLTADCSEASALNTRASATR